MSRVACQITKHGVDAPQVEEKADIKKSTLHFVGNFWQTRVWHRLGPAGMDNALTLDQVMLWPSIIVGYDINFARYIRDAIHE